MTKSLFIDGYDPEFLHADDFSQTVIRTAKTLAGVQHFYLVNVSVLI